MTPSSPEGPSKALVDYLRRTLSWPFDELLAAADFLDEDDQASVLAVFEDLVPVIANEIANRDSAYQLMAADARADRDTRLDRLTAEVERLRERVHTAVDETQRRYAPYQSRCHKFDVWSKWAREVYERHGGLWGRESEATRLVVQSLLQERDALSGLLRGMARRLAEVRQSLRFADAHVPQWERVISEHKDEIARLRAQLDKAVVLPPDARESIELAVHGDKDDADRVWDYLYKWRAAPALNELSSQGGDYLKTEQAGFVPACPACVRGENHTFEQIGWFHRDGANLIGVAAVAARSEATQKDIEGRPPGSRAAEPQPTSLALWTDDDEVVWEVKIVDIRRIATIQLVDEPGMVHEVLLHELHPVSASSLTTQEENR